MTKPRGRFFLNFAIFAYALVISLFGVGIFMPNPALATNVSVTLNPSSGVAEATLPVQIMCYATAIDSVISEYQIDFGDGTSATATTSAPSHTFTHEYTAGVYSVVCTLILSQGGSSKSTPVRLVLAKWRFQTGGAIDSSPAIAPDGSAVYVGSNDGNLYAIDPATGTELWHYSTNDSIRSSPAVGSDGTIYFGSLDGKLYALRPINGTLKWVYPIGSAIFPTPAIDADDNIYIGASNGEIYSFTASLSERWHFQTGGAIVSSPSIGYDGVENVLYVGSIDQHVYALDADNGTLKWKFPTNAPVYASPAIAPDGKIYVGECQTQSAATYDFKFYCLNIDGTENWNIDTGAGVYASAAIASSGTIYVGSWDGTFYALKSTGATLWSKSVYRSFNSTPAIGNNGVVYVGCKDDNFYALQSPNVDKDKRQDWTFKTGDSIVFSSPVIGSDGTIYFGSRDGSLYAVKPGSIQLPSSGWPMFHRSPNHDGMAQDITLPAVISTSPAPDAQDVNINTSQIRVTFSPDITSDDIVVDSFQVVKGDGSDTEAQPLPGYSALQQNGDYMSAVFVFENSDSLSYKREYTASIDYVDPTTSETKTYTWSFKIQEKPVNNPSSSPKPAFCFISAAGG